MGPDSHSGEVAETQLPQQQETDMTQAFIPSAQLVTKEPVPQMATTEQHLTIGQFVEKTDTGIRITVPLEFLKGHYYYGLRPLLHTPATSDEESAVEEEPIDQHEQQIDETEDDQHHHPVEDVITKKTKKKSKRRKPIGPDAEYDFEDPFIDDTDANVQGYVSIFDLMAGRMDSLKDIESEEEEAEQAPNEDQAKIVKFATSTIDRANDFFVYQGPLVTSRSVERDFERTKAKKKKKRPMKRISPTKKSPTKKRPAQQQQTEENTTSGEAKLKKKRPMPEKKALVDTLAAQLFDAETEKAIETKSSVEPLFLKTAASNDSMPRENESPVAGKSPEKAKRTPSDNEKELDSFRKAAHGVPIERNKFPAVLRAPMDTLLLTLARMMPHMSTVTYMIPSALLSQLSAMLPFSDVALNRVICKKIIPLLIGSIESKLHPLYEELRLLATTEHARLVTAEHILDTTTDGAPTAGKPVFRFDERMRRALFDLIRHENDLILLNNIHAKWQQLDPDHASTAPPLVSYASPTTRKNLYKKILDTSFTDTTVTSSMLSAEYGVMKRRWDRLCMREVSKMDAATTNTNNAAVVDEGGDMVDTSQVIDVVQE